MCGVVMTLRTSLSDIFGTCEMWVRVDGNEVWDEDSLVLPYTAVVIWSYDRSEPDWRLVSIRIMGVDINTNQSTSFTLSGSHLDFLPSWLQKFVDSHKPSEVCK